MTRLIDADALLEKFNENDCGMGFSDFEIHAFINNAPTVQREDEANKLIKVLVGEIAELKEKFKSYKEESLNEIVSLNKACYEYKTNINDLREALLAASRYVDHFDPASSICKIISEALAATPAKSLQAFENDVIEKCAIRGRLAQLESKVVDIEIRALKQEVS